MELSEIINSVISFLKDNPIIAVVVALVLIFLIWRKTKLFFTILFIAIILFGTIYLIMSMASSGKSVKEKLIQEEKKQFEKIR